MAYGSHLGDRLEWTAFAGPRLSRAQDASPLGGSEADAVSFGVSAEFPLVRTERFLFGPTAGFAATHAWFRGKVDETEQRAIGLEFSGWGIMTRGGVALRLQLDDVFLGARTSVGAAIARLQITDGETLIGGVTGLEWSNSIALGWSWRQ